MLYAALSWAVLLTIVNRSRRDSSINRGSRGTGIIGGRMLWMGNTRLFSGNCFSVAFLRNLAVGGHAVYPGRWNWRW